MPGRKWIRGHCRRIARHEPIAKPSEPKRAGRIEAGIVMLTRLEPFIIVGTLLVALIWLLMLPLGDVLEYAGLDEDNVGLIQRAWGPALWAVAFTGASAWLIRRQ